MGRSQRVGDDDLVHLYLSDVGRHALLTKDDETRLAKLIEAGADARRQLRDLNGVAPGRPQRCAAANCASACRNSSASPAPRGLVR